jgi:GNAT superfamily N-acetyltransferase
MSSSLMQEIVIRDATEADLDAVTNLWKALEDAQDAHRALPKAPDADKRFIRSFRAALTDPQQAWFVAERGGAVVGMAFAHLDRPSRMSAETVLELSRVVVPPDERGRGIAAALVARAEAFARECGAGHLGVKVLVSNTTAAAFWARSGFFLRRRAAINAEELS